MELKWVLYKEEELQIKGRFQRDVAILWENLEKNNIIHQSIWGEISSEKLMQEGIEPNEVLVIGARDDTIGEAKSVGAAAIGYLNPEILGQGLYKADLLVEEFWEIDTSFLIKMYQRAHGIPWRVLETKRCYLREMTVMDLDDLYRMYQGEGMTRYMEPLYDRQKEEEYTKSYIKNIYGFYGYGMWLVKDRTTHDLIGRAGLNITDSKEEAVLELGYAISVPYQRQGYATEVCLAILDFAKYAELPFSSIQCFIHLGNQASIALMKHLSFDFMGMTDREGVPMLWYQRPFG